MGEGLRIHVLGGFSLEVDGTSVELGWRLRKAETLIKLLALQPGHLAHRDQLLELLWPQLTPDAGTNQLRKALHVARRSLDPDPEAAARFLVRRGEVLAFRPDAVWVDMATFERAAALARREATVVGYEAALAVYGGELLPDDRYEEWALEPRRLLEEEVVDLLVELAGILEGQGELAQAASSLESAMALRPFHEEAAAALMRVHALAGHRAEALRRYERLRADLLEELGVEPASSVQQLYEEIRTDETPEPELVVGMWERVGDLRLVAGEANGAVAAFESALRQNQRAGLPDQARLHRKTAQALLARHDSTDAIDHVKQASAALADVADDAELVQVEAVRAHCLCELGRFEEALTAAARSVEAAETVDDPDVTAAAHEAAAIVSHFRGAWNEGLHQEIARLQSGDEDLNLGRVFDIHHCIGQYHLYGDDLFAEVEDYARDTLELASRKRARRAQAFGWCLLGESLLLTGRWEEAAACLRRSADIHAEFGHASGALAWQRLAELAACKGDQPGVERHLERATAIATVSPMARHLWGRIYATLGFDALERDEPDTALRAVHSAARAAARYGDCPSCSALLHPVAAEAHSLLGDAEAAAEHASDAALLAEMWHSSAWRGMAETAAGFAALAAGESDAARQRFLTSADLYEKGGQPFWAARSWLQAAQTDTDHPGASALFTKAVDTFAGLGAVRAESRARLLLTDRTSPTPHS